MSRKRRNYPLEFNAKVALAVIKGDLILSELGLGGVWEAEIK